jgi:hypothetical protein
MPLRAQADILFGSESISTAHGAWAAGKWVIRATGLRAAVTAGLAPWHPPMFNRPQKTHLGLCLCARNTTPGVAATAGANNLASAASSVQTIGHPLRWAH